MSVRNAVLVSVLVAVLIAAIITVPVYKNKHRDTRFANPSVKVRPNFHRDLRS